MCMVPEEGLACTKCKSCKVKCDLAQGCKRGAELIVNSDDVESETERLRKKAKVTKVVKPVAGPVSVQVPELTSLALSQIMEAIEASNHQH